MATHIYVGNLAGTAGADDLVELFGRYGPVVMARVIVDRATGRSRGFAFVAMAQHRDAERAVQALDGAVHHDQPLSVGLVEVREKAHGGGAGQDAVRGSQPTAPDGKNGQAATGTTPAKVPPEILEWARRQFSEEEIVAGVREVHETGGLELKEFIGEIEDVLFPPNE